MKTKLSLLTSSVAALALSSYASDQLLPSKSAPAPETHIKAVEPSAQPAPEAGNPLEIGRLARVSQLIHGPELTTTDGVEFGKISAVAIDLESGRVLGTVLTREGWLTDRSVFVPVSWLGADANRDEHVFLRASSAELKKAPKFNLNKWSEEFASGRHAVPGEIPATVERADKLMGIRVNDEAGQHLGNVEHILVDLNRQRVMHVTIFTAGKMGVNDVRATVPPMALRPGADGESLTLTVPKENLAMIPRFNPIAWADVRDENFGARVYHYNGATPYFASSLSAAEVSALARQEYYTPPGEAVVAEIRQLPAQDDRKDGPDDRE